MKSDVTFERKDSRTRTTPSAPSETFNKFAALVSGVVVLGLGGLGLGFVLDHFEFGTGALVGLGGGALLGLIAGRRIARSESVLGGMVAGALVPVAVVLIGALRSGRLFDASPEELVSPMALLVFGGLAVTGAVTGSLLVLGGKLIVRLACGSGDNASA